MKRLNDLDKYVIFSIAILLLFTIAEMITSFWTGTHDTLTTALFATFGGEILSCALIKIFKLRKDDDECDWREKYDGDDSTDSGVDCADL